MRLFLGLIPLFCKTKRKDTLENNAVLERDRERDGTASERVKGGVLLKARGTDTGRDGARTCAETTEARATLSSSAQGTVNLDILLRKK